MLNKLKARTRAGLKDGVALRSLELIYGNIVRFVPLDIRYGPEFKRMREFLLESQAWPMHKLEEYQVTKTARILKYAQQHIPWYQKKFAEWGVCANDFKCIDDIKKFPFLTKEDIRDNLHDLVSPKYRRMSLTYVTTGGSTGVPVGFFQDRVVQAVEHAFNAHYWSWYGCKPMDTCVILRGGYVGTRLRPFKYSPSTNDWHFSIYYLTRSSVEEYVARLNKIRPKFIQAYPSAVSLLASLMAERNLRLEFRPNAIMCASEILNENQSRLIEETFHCPVHSQYGQSERVTLAATTPKSPLYHVFPQYGLTELLDEDGKEVVQDEGVGEIVGTGFHNFAMPLIRYRTQDRAVHSNNRARAEFDYRLFARIDGRLQELVFTRSGRTISMTAINMHDNTFDSIAQFQFCQEVPGQLVMNVVPRSTFGEVERTLIESRLRAKLGEDMDLWVNVVDRIPLTPSGKMRFLIQKCCLEPSRKANVE